jgi:sugar (pentulose or hexulose) kinase
MEAVAVFDHGKTNLKLSLAAPDGTILAARTTPTPTRPGPPYRHADLDAVERWLIEGLGAFGEKRAIAAVVATGHGSAGVLVDGEGPVLPMLDYEETVPPGIDAEYRRVMPGYGEAGSGILGGATHLARQLHWLEACWPGAVARARHLLPLPQYWAWRLSGVAALELTSLGAQSHLWDARERRFTNLVAARGWNRLLPAIRPAWDRLAPLTGSFRRATGLGPGTEVLCGIHDSSAALYRWRRARLGAATLLSTGTWIVGLRAGLDPAALRRILVEARSMTANVDVDGGTVAGVLTMTGRERAVLAGEGTGPADAEDVARVVRGRTVALPSFVPFDGVFPGSAGRGSIEGPMPKGPGERAALATLYAALLADACVDLLGDGAGTVVLDGGLTADPAFGGLVAALAPGREVLVDASGDGTTIGAALLWTHGHPAPPAASPRKARPLEVPGLAAYRERWRALAEAAGGRDEEP